MIVLFEHTIKRQNERQRFEAAIHGAEVKGGESKRGSKEAVKEEEGIFKDPSYYEGMTAEERKAETVKMKRQLGVVMKNIPLGN